jgi:hypothetical protein
VSQNRKKVLGKKLARYRKLARAIQSEMRDKVSGLGAAA